MATIRLSTGMRDGIIAKKAEPGEQMTADTIAFVDGGGSNDSITDSGNGLAGFTVGRKIRVTDSTSNNVLTEMLTVAAGTIGVATDTLATESAGDQVVLAEAIGGSWADLLENGTMEIYSGTMPTDPDAVITATVLAKITESGEAFVADAAANGINFDTAASGVLSKDTSETWSGVGLAAGTAAWACIFSNAYDKTASTTAVRMLVDVATSGAVVTMSDTSVAVDGSNTIDSATLTQPAV
ncbi:MAG: hypothetical protein GY820_38930 [Gammaproteobacteria bacterium]|nr:hypothetical protein [Gammaproteobacteria bacterium]